MHHARGVRCDQARADPPRESQRPLDGEPPLARQQRREVGPVHVGHGDVLEALDLPEVVDAHHILVGDEPGQEQLALEPALDFRRGGRVTDDVGPDELDRDVDAEPVSHAW